MNLFYFIILLPKLTIVLNPNIIYCKNIRGWGIVDIDNRKRKRILIIDDDLDINNLFKIYLEHDGFQTDAYTNPIDTLSQQIPIIYEKIIQNITRMISSEITGLVRYRLDQEV